MRQALLVMSKRPEAGRTKTRLSPPMSAKEAAGLYESFLLDALALARAVPDVKAIIAYSPPDARDYFQQLAPDFALFPQLGDSLGERLDAVLTASLNLGYDRVAAINSDSPNLPAEYIARAFDLLHDEALDVVFGPCDDGGYYLIGVKAPHPRLVRDVQMSTPHVLRDTLAVAKREGLTTKLLPMWYDVDAISDLQRLQTDLEAAPQQVARHTRRFLKKLA